MNDLELVLEKLRLTTAEQVREISAATNIPVTTIHNYKYGYTTQIPYERVASLKAALRHIRVKKEINT